MRYQDSFSYKIPSTSHIWLAPLVLPPITKDKPIQYFEI